MLEDEIERMWWKKQVWHDTDLLQRKEVLPKEVPKEAKEAKEEAKEVPPE